VGVVVVLVLGGCAARSPAPAGEPTTPRAVVPASDVPASDPDPTATERALEGGISLEEASELGLLTGQYDALLEGPMGTRLEGDCSMLTFELRNVGEDPDHYEVTAEPAEVRVDPAALDLGPGQRAELTARACPLQPGTRVTVRSRGRNDIVAERRL